MSVNLRTEEFKQSLDNTSVFKFAKHNASEVIVKCEPMEIIPPDQIKTEVADDAYEHEVKEKMAIGPVVLQGGSVESSGGDNTKMTIPSSCASLVSIKLEPEDVIVKSEHEEAASSIEIEVPALYQEHVIKEEMVTGPAMLQKDASLQCYANIDTCKMSDRNFHIATQFAHAYNMEHDFNTRNSQQPIENKEYNIMNNKVSNKASKTKLRKAEMVHENGYPFVCDYCNKEYIQKEDLLNHIRVHTGEYKFKCSICEEKVHYNNMNSHLQSHVEANQSIHNIQYEYVFCEICQKQLKRSNLSQHCKIHTKEKPFKCDICDKRYSKKKTLQDHQVIHSGDKPFPCNMCDKRFYDKKDLARHQTVHSGVKPFPCDICDKRFYYKMCLKRHMSTHTGDQPFPCDVCDKRFFNEDDLKGHKAMHTGDKLFTCEVCNKGFNWKRNLQAHQVIHTGFKQFSCDMCDKRYYDKSGLKKHKVKHTGVRPFPCDICDKRFYNKHDVKRHVRQMHKNNAVPSNSVLPTIDNTREEVKTK